MSAVTQHLSPVLLHRRQQRLAWGGAGAGAAAGAKGGAGGGAPVPVITALAIKRNLDINLQAVGTVVPVATVDIRAQMTGMVTKVWVQDGQTVKAGQTLLTLDARADEANVAKVRAQMAKDQASLADAKRQLVRAQDLVAKNFISQGAADTNQSTVEGLTATVAADKAALDAALLSLSYAQVRAPSGGRLGTVAVSPGSAVQANVTPLVTLTQFHPINVGFNLPQSQLQGLVAGLQGAGAPVRARLPDAKTDLEGRLVFVDSALDAATGTVKARARFDNQAGKLWPGAFVNVSLQADSLRDALVVPAAAVIQTQRGTIVYVVEQGKAALKPVQVLSLQGDIAAVSGIQDGDRVVVEGRQNLRPDSAVVEREASKPSDGEKKGKP
ncbi:MAG: efflux RND transporter periplasmic adaptor subunit [Rhodoferax sp.]|nr:efflux RND transporter periplasmic adaptor subunit [Rhodoferax sp.]